LKVKVFSTLPCPFCSMVKDFLNKHNIPFEDINVTENHEAAHEMIEKSGQMGVPVIIINGGKGKNAKETVIVGFDVVRLKKALKIKD
jgi:glutaredoxin-like YruB-family protein